MTNTMNKIALSFLGLGLSIGVATTAHAEGSNLNYLNCQAANSFGTATVGLAAAGDVLIQTTSVAGTQDDHYDIGNVTRILENNRGSRLHLVNKDDNKPGVLLVFHREMPSELTRLDGYLYSVTPKFNPSKDAVPAVPVAFVSCSVQFK